MIKKCKRPVSVLLAVMLLLFNTCVSARFITPGEKTYADVSINVSTNTAYEHEFYLPFDSGSVTIDYSAATDVSITVNTGQQSLTEALSAGEASATISFPQVERKGERKYTFLSSGDVELKLTFNKYENANVSVVGAGDATSDYGNLISLPDLGVNGNAIQTAVIIDRTASAVVVRGAHRYINNDAADEVPSIIDGSIYLPARVLALALGCYYEYIPDKNFVFIRESESGKEFYFKKDESYTLTNFDGTETFAFKPIYKSGQPYLPVRFLAEAIGKTVGYKDGIVVIDDKFSVESILNTPSIFEYVQGLFEAYRPTEAAGKEYHVSKDGNDANSGTADKPFLTLNKAAQTAAAGDTVIIHEGVYRETLKPLNSGTATNPIIFRAADNEDVVISATEEISGFTAYSGNTAWLQASVPENLGDGKNQVFYNNECIAEARHPNNTAENSIYADGKQLSSLFPAKGDFKVDENDITLVTSPSLLNQADGFWNGATFVSMHGYGWRLCTAKIASSEDGKLHLDSASFAKHWWFKPADHSSLWNYGYISGHKNAIDSPGEWVMEGNTLIINPPDGKNASTLKVEVKQRQLTVDLTDRRYVQIQGIKSFGGSALMKNSEMCILNGVDMKYISHYTYSNDQRDGYIDEHIPTQGGGEDGAPPRGEVGVYISGRNNAVINSVIDHSAAAGIYLAGLYAYIDNNEISNCGYMGSSISGIVACSEPWSGVTDPRGGFAIYNNTVYNAGCTLIAVIGQEFDSGAWSSETTTNGVTYNVPYVPYEVAYNDLHDAALMSMDIGTVYSYKVTCATDKLESRVHSNYVYSTADGEHPWSNGIYSDGGSIGINYYNNVVFTTKNPGAFSYDYLSLGKTVTTSTDSANSFVKEPVTGGAAALTAEHFPLGKPFYAGRLTGAEPYMENFEKTGTAQEFYSVDTAELEGTTLDTSKSAALLDGNADEIVFKNVDFGGGKNRINVYYTADKYSTNNALVVTVGDKKCEVPIRVNGNTLETIDFASADFGEKLTGTHDVSIKLRSAGRAAPFIKGIMLSNAGKNGKGHDASNIDAADYDCVYQLVNGNEYVRTAAQGYGRYVMNGTNGTILLYKNVDFASMAANKLQITYKAFNSYPDVTIYLDSPTDGNKILKYDAVDTDGSFVTYTYDLTKNVSGVHDIYIGFTIGGNVYLDGLAFLPAE